ncbi:MAG: enoyl-CoA hydratase/isomerase family protein [Alphaproteobacteria bacterium]
MKILSILFEVKNQIGIATLNRSNVLNSLNFEMISALKKQLLVWKNDPDIQFVVIKSDSEKAFCAGGDLKEVYQAGKDHDYSFLKMFFEEEYALNQLIFNYPKPYLSFMNGITMGGGMGISVHGSHRIITENSVLAMPEVFIGFFPDVGGSYFLNKCPGKIGMLLGLSGYRMNAADALYTGIGTHYIPQKNLPLLWTALTETDVSIYPAGGIAAILELFSEPVPMLSPLQQHRALIDDYFDEEDTGLLVEGLRLCKNFWMKGVFGKILEASPLSVAVTHHLLKMSKNISFNEAMKNELDLALKFFNTDEVLEGIRSVVIDKDRSPEWKYKSVSSVPEELIESYFK